MSIKEFKSLGGTIVMVLAIIIAGMLARASSISKAAANDLSVATAQQEAVNESATEESQPQTRAVRSASDSDGTKQPIATNPTTVRFTQEFAQQDADFVVIALDARTTELDGTCTFTLSLGSKTVTRSNEASRTTCSISIPTSAFSDSGFWNMTHTYESSDGSSIGNSSGAYIEITL